MIESIGFMQAMQFAACKEV